MGMAALEGRPPRIEEHILAATSPEQMGFALAALGAQKAILGDRSPLEAIIETLPDRAINYASITKLLHLWLGWNAEIGLHHLCMERLKDPRVTQAIYAVLHHLDGYIEGARLMYHLPVYNYPDIIPVQLLGARDDMVMGEASMNAYAERLRQNYFLDVNLHMEERGGHFAIGKKHPIRQKHVELLIQATERLTG